MFVIAVIGLFVCMALAPAEAAENEAVSVRMKWFFAGTMAPWFHGKAAGHFDKEGLTVAINPGGPDSSSVKLVAAKADTFGVAGADEVLKAQEIGVPVAAIGVVFKESPVVFIAKASSGINRLGDWTGKTIEVAYGSSEELQYRALKALGSVRPASEIPYTFNVLPFLEGRVDISVAYLMDQVVTLKGKGVALNIFHPKDFGIAPYGDVIIVHRDTLHKRLDLVDRFLRATRASFAAALKSPEEAAAALVKAQPGVGAQALPVWQASIPLIFGTESPGQILRFSEDRWKDTANFLKQYGYIKPDTDPARAYVRRSVLDSESD